MGAGLNTDRQRELARAVFRRLLDEHGGQVGVARLLGCNQGTISRAARGLSSPDLVLTAARLAQWDPLEIARVFKTEPADMAQNDDAPDLPRVPPSRPLPARASCRAYRARMRGAHGRGRWPRYVRLGTERRRRSARLSRGRFGVTPAIV